MLSLDCTDMPNSAVCNRDLLLARALPQLTTLMPVQACSSGCSL